MSPVPPTPDEILRKRGTHGNHWRVTTAPPTKPRLPRAKPGQVPKPPRPLGIAGRGLWKRTWEAGIDWITPKSDVETLLVVCEAVDEYAALRREVLAWEPGPMDLDRKRLYDSLRDLRKQLMQGLSLLGFSPADRARLNVGEVAEVDPLQEFRESS